MNIERLVDQFIQLVKINSETGKESEIAHRLVTELTDLGLEVVIDDKVMTEAEWDTGNIIARLPGTTDAPSLLFCAHMDTVPPGEHVKPRIENGVIYSNGTTILGADDKCGIAAILEALRHIQEEGLPHGPVEVLFTVAEEGGLLGSNHLNTELIKSTMAFVLDSGKELGKVIHQGPAKANFRVTIKGKAGHAAFPEEGINAIQVAARAIDRMQLAHIDDETTANIGFIQGGIAGNVICDTVDMKLEVRSLDPRKLSVQVEQIQECLARAARDFHAHAHVEVSYSYPQFKVASEDEIFQLAGKAMRSLGLNLELDSTMGGSDTNLLNKKGIKAVTLATGMKKVHTTQEQIAIADLKRTAELVIALVEEAARS